MKKLEFTNDTLIKFNYDFPIFNWFQPYDVDELNTLEKLKYSNNYKVLENLPSEYDNIALYFHIPFCEDICAFCPFFREILKDKTKIDEYVNSLINEISLKKEYLKNYKINSIFFGGGTPSILTVPQIEKIGIALKEAFDFSHLKEFSFEMNAKTITEEKSKILKKIGVTNIRIGVQTFNEKYRELFSLSAKIEQIKQGIFILKNDFSKISIDLMYGFNGQSIEHFILDLIESIKLDVPNISLYPLNNLSIQERLLKSYSDKKLNPVSGLDRIGMKIIAKKIMMKNGYYPHNGHDFVKTKEKPDYFITNSYSFEYHKSVYGTENSFLVGFGAGSISFFNGYMTMNENHINNYIENLINNKAGNVIICTYDKQIDIERPLRLFLPYHGRIAKNKINKVKVSDQLKIKLDSLIDHGLIKETDSEYLLTEEGWLSYVDILFFLSPERDQKLLLSSIEKKEQQRDIGKWNFSF